ncbi:hypothetical protein [Nocardia anaemiae]|uniref:hypothetical protein n=1 Tax=Nocardia anaemiae TaxID=263910 RepID=UPI000B0853F8|nr:hypothetical protein [Nocardia anaemiae]
MTDREPSQVDVAGGFPAGQPVEVPVTFSWPRDVAYVKPGANTVVRTLLLALVDCLRSSTACARRLRGVETS